MVASEDRAHDPPDEAGAAVSDTDTGWLLVGKLAPPEQRITVVHREALLVRLNEGLSRPLSVVVSPPGFGKTTLLTQWWRTLATRPDVAAAWLTVDELDSEVSRFMAGLILALARAGVDVGPLEVAALQQSIDTNVRPIVAALLEAIRRSSRRSNRRIVLVLDDFHRARSAAVGEVMETLIERGHRELHLVVSGRHKPLLRVSALRARGLVTSLGAADLALSLTEASEVLGPDVSRSDLSILYSRTEGWAVALQLARLWIDRGNRRPDSLCAFSGRTTDMTDYLAEQVVQDLPADLQDFLLETAILERFDSGLANAVRGRSDSATLLTRLEHFDALLVPLDGSRDWFRYHRLFADFLSQRLKRGSPEQAAALHRRAARTLATLGDLQEGVRHAIKADDLRLAVDLTQEAGGWELILWRGVGYARNLIKEFDPVIIRGEPTLQLTQAYLDMKLGLFENAREMLVLAEASTVDAQPRIRRDYTVVEILWRIYVDGLADQKAMTDLEACANRLDPTDHLGRGTMLAALAVAELAAGDMARAETTSRQAIQSMRAAGSVLGTNYTFLHLAQAQLMRGHIREANALFREASMMAEDNFGAESSLKTLCSTFMAYWCYMHGDLEAAGKLIESSFQTTDGWVDVFVSGYEVRARLAFARGGIADAIDVISEAVRTARDRHLDRLGAIAAAWRVEFLALAGHVRDARREAQAAGVFAGAALRGPPDFNWRPRLASTIAIARLYIAAGETAQALLLLNTASTEFRNGDLTLCAHRLDALAIVALNRRGDTAEAIERLQSLLEFVVAEGASGLLIEQGSGLVSLLHVIQRKNHELVVSGMQRDVVANVLATLQRQHLSTQSGFSARELDVLRELCHGRSNKSIGQMLDLSENTVKFHLKRIFRKLGADSRAGAIAAALQRNLVDSGEGPKKPIRP